MSKDDEFNLHLDPFGDRDKRIKQMNDEWDKARSIVPHLEPIKFPDAKLSDKASKAMLESLEVLRRIEMNTEYLKDIVGLLSTSNEHQEQLNGLVHDVLAIAKAPDKEEAQSRYRSVMKKIGDFSTVTTSALNIVKLSSLWSWDYAGSDEVHSKQLIIFGHKYNAAKFNLEPFYGDIDADKVINHGTGLTGSYYYVIIKKTGLLGIERYHVSA